MAGSGHAAVGEKSAMLTHAERLQIKAQTKLAVRECGGQEAAAEASDRIVRHQSLSDYGNPSMGDKFISLDTAAELDRFSGNPRFAKLLAELSGGIFVPLPEGRCAGRLELAAGKSAGEFGDVMVALGAALKDGRVDTNEARRILKEILEAIVALAGLAEDVKAESATRKENITAAPTGGTG